MNALREVPRAFMHRSIEQLTIAGLLLLTAACDGTPTAPRFATLSAIQYQRERPYDPAITDPLSLALNCPIPGDPYGRSQADGCILVHRGSQVFECPNAVSWHVPTDADCSIQVHDPAVTTNAFHTIATAVFVNSQRLRRVEVSANGVETARFRVTSRGEIQ
jgi:hypothetical protein